MRFLSYRMKDFSWRYYRHLLVCTDCFVVVDGSFALIECTGPSFVLTGLSPCLEIASFLNTRHKTFEFGKAARVFWHENV